MFVRPRTVARRWLRRAAPRLRAVLLGLIAPSLFALACRGRESGEPAFVAELARELVAGEVTRAGIEGKLVYRLAIPPDYDSSSRYPLILYLHGSGKEGTDNRRHLGAAVRQLLDRTNDFEKVFVLVPQCPRDKWILGEEKSPHVNYAQSERTESDGLKLALGALDEVVGKYPIDHRRIYVVGFSAGAAGTWDLITRHPERRFAAAVTMTGNNDPSRAKLIARLPIWAFHGALDAASPVRNTREMVAALRELGSPVRYTEYPDLGHGISLEPFARDELIEWLFAQRAGDTR